MFKKNFNKIFLAITSALYPFAIWFLLKQEGKIWLLLCLLSFLVILSYFKIKKISILIIGLILILLFGISKNEIYAKLYPVLMNFSFALTFFISLSKTPLIVQFVKKIEKNPSKEKLQYAKKVTIAWCIFLSLNTLMSFITVFLSNQAWILYNGFISYILMGMMFVGEFFIRKRSFKC